MQMTSKLEEPGRKAAITNKTKRRDAGRAPEFAPGEVGRLRLGGERRPGEQKATRSSLRGREGEGTKAGARTPPRPPDAVHKR